MAGPSATTTSRRRAHCTWSFACAAVAMLAEQPGLGRPGRVPGTRELIVAKTRYLVPYRVRGGTVEVLRVFHTSRRLPNQW
jgi:plasmid stabilization system protein ParE